MKYVIKNCDNYTEFDKNWTCRSTIQNRKGCYCCQDCTDCLIKQVIDKCKKKLQLSTDYARNPYSGGVYQVATEILQLFDIEEVRE